MTTVIAKTLAALHRLEYNLDEKAVEEAHDVIAASRVVTLTGVGKSFAVAQLGASLLQSVGYHAAAVHATDMMHGSLGVLAGDMYGVVVFVSHSGNTEEIVDLLDVIEQYEPVNTIAVTGNENSEIAERCKIALTYKIGEDGSKYGTIPSVSVAMQLAIINTIVCAAADDLSAKELGALHPSGMLHDRYEEIAGE